MRWLCLLLIFYIQLSFAFSCNESKSIIAKPILMDQHRIDLTLEYQLQHYGIDSPSILIEPKIIVLHWTAFPTLQRSFDEFYPAELSADRTDIKSGGNLNVSVPYLVDRDGTIYQLMPDNWLAKHVIGLNHIAIGIENVGGAGDQADLTEEQVEANAFLVCYLKKKYPTIRYLIGHYEYLKFKGTSLWQEKDPNYQTSKTDPGPEFMQKVRKFIKPLRLKGAPD